MGLLSPVTIIYLAMLVAPAAAAFVNRSRFARPGLVLSGAVMMSISGGFTLIRLAAFNPGTSPNLQLFTALSIAGTIFSGILPLVGTMLMIFGATTKASAQPAPLAYQQSSSAKPTGSLPGSVPAPPAPPTWQQPAQPWR